MMTFSSQHVTPTTFCCWFLPHFVVDFYHILLLVFVRLWLKCVPYELRYPCHVMMTFSSHTYMSLHRYLRFRAALRPIYMDSDFQCRMQQLHPKIGIILFFVRCRMQQPHLTLKIPVCVNRPLSSQMVKRKVCNLRKIAYKVRSLFRGKKILHRNLEKLPFPHSLWLITCWKHVTSEGSQLFIGRFTFSHFRVKKRGWAGFSWHRSSLSCITHSFTLLFHFGVDVIITVFCLFSAKKWRFVAKKTMFWFLQNLAVVEKKRQFLHQIFWQKYFQKHNIWSWWLDSSIAFYSL
jgi:hypothetical protein